MTHSLGVRFGLAVFSLVWIPLIVATGWGAQWLWQRMESRPSAALQSLALRGDALNLTEAASSLAETIDAFLLDRIVEVQTWAASSVVVDAVHKARAAHAKQGFDNLSIQEIEDKFRIRKSLGLAPGARAYLSEQVRASPHFAEIFFTDELGFNVALSNPTTDFVQSDERWWRQAWSSGFSVGSIEFDASANVWAVDLSVVIRDKRNRNPIGVMKAVLSIRFVQFLSDRVARRLSRPDHLLHAQLSDPSLDGKNRDVQYPGAHRTQFVVSTRDGMLIAETRSAHARGRIMQTDVSIHTDPSLAHLNLSYDGDPTGSFIANRNDTGNSLSGTPPRSQLVAYSRSAGTGFYAPAIDNFSGFNWTVIAEAPNLSGYDVLPELTGTPLQTKPNWARDILLLGAGLCGVLLFSSIILCWLFGKWVLSPVRTLITCVQRIEQGHIGVRVTLSSKGELADLAASIDRIRTMIGLMADRLRQTSTGRRPPGTPESGMPRQGSESGGS